MDTTQSPSDGSKNGFSLVITLLSMSITLMLCLAYLGEVNNPCSYTKADYGGSEFRARQCRSGLEKDNGNQIAVNQPATPNSENSGW
jgi:hypothetical protein